MVNTPTHTDNFRVSTGYAINSASGAKITPLGHTKARTYQNRILGCHKNEKYMFYNHLKCLNIFKQNAFDDYIIYLSIRWHALSTVHIYEERIE